MRRGMRGLGLAVAALLLVALAAACGGQAPPAAPPSQPTAPKESQPAAPTQSAPPQKEAAAGPAVQMALTLGGTTGSYYLHGAAVAEFVNKSSSKIRLVPSVSAGGVENLRRVSKGEMPIGQTTVPDIPEAWEGKGAFKEQLRDFRIIGPSIAPIIMHIVVLAKSGIQSLDDLKGKTFVPGAPGASTTVATELLLKELGLQSQMKIQYFPQAEFPNLLKNGVIDGFSRGANYPAAFVEEINATHPVRNLDVGKDLEKSGFLKKYPFYTSEVIPAGTYKGQDKDVVGFGFASFWIANKDVAADAVYEFSRLNYGPEMLAHLDKAYKQHAQGIAEPLAGLPVALHPGAEKYWKERGIKIPDPLLKP